MSMTLEQVRDWLLSRSQDGHMQRSVYVSDYQLREMADTITAHLAQPRAVPDIVALKSNVWTMAADLVATYRKSGDWDADLCNALEHEMRDRAASPSPGESS